MTSLFNGAFGPTPRRRVISVMTFALAFACAAGVPAAGQTIDEAMGRAYQSNPTLEAARAALRAVDEGVPQAKDGWRPRVELLGDFGGQRRRNNFTPTKDSRLSYGSSLRVTQQLYDGGATGAEVDAAQADVMGERARLTSTEQGVLLAVVEAYMDVVSDQAVLELTSQNELRLRRQLEATKDRFEVGEVTRTDVAQAESRVARANADVIEAGAALEVSRAAYEEAVGTLPGTLLKPAFSVTLPVSREETIALATDRNPDVVAALWDRRSALRDIRSAYADLLPSVDLVGEASHDRVSGNTDTTVNELSLIASLTVPLYQKGTEQSQVRQSKQLAAQALRTIEAQRRAAVEAATSAWENHQAALATIEAVQEEVRATEIALEGVEQEASVGARTVLDVLDAEQEVLDAQVSLVRAERDEMVARYELLSATGSLTARDLSLPVDLYNEADHYEQVRNKLWGIGPPVESAPDDDYAPETPYFVE